MNQYLKLLTDVLENGTIKSDRTGTGTRSLFGYQMRFNLSDGFPLVTTKKTHLKSIIYELLWFLKGDTNIAYLNNNGVTIWDEWADANGDLGPVYGAQWRHWGRDEITECDQIETLLYGLKYHPDSRRHIISAWNVEEIPQMSLPPCHLLSQFYVADGKLSCQLYQRSADVFLGLPFNIASYSLLTMMIAQVTGFGLGEFVHTIGDAHLYLNHTEQAKTQLERKPYKLPTMKLNQDVTDILDFKFADFELINYKSHPAIKAPIAV